MGRVFITGDKHGNLDSPYDYRKIIEFCKDNNTTTDDVMIILGDHGINYDDGDHDMRARVVLKEQPITFVMIRGNHDRRVKPKWTHEWIDNGTLYGLFINDPIAENILYTEEFGWYRFSDIDTFTINGAYSADKYYRLAKQAAGEWGYRWFFDEQLNEAERMQAADMLKEGLRESKDPYCIMSHTCPIRYKPTEGLLPGIDQSKVDETMENWMDELLNEVGESKPVKWYCGHWHLDKTDDIVRFMNHDIIEFGKEREASALESVEESHEEGN